jgi:hypothetical protein
MRRCLVEVGDDLTVRSALGFEHPAAFHSSYEHRSSPSLPSAPDASADAKDDSTHRGARADGVDIVHPSARRELYAMSEETRMPAWKKAAYAFGAVVALILIVISFMFG